MKSELTRQIEVYEKNTTKEKNLELLEKREEALLAGGNAAIRKQL
jgi:hypothetical protein